MTTPMPGVVQKLLLYFCTDLLAKNDPGFSEKVLQSCGLMDHNISSFHSGEQKNSGPSYNAPDFKGGGGA